MVASLFVATASEQAKTVTLFSGDQSQHTKRQPPSPPPQSREAAEQAKQDQEEEEESSSEMSRAAHTRSKRIQARRAQLSASMKGILVGLHFV